MNGLSSRRWLLLLPLLLVLPFHAGWLDFEQARRGLLLLLVGGVLLLRPGAFMGPLRHSDAALLAFVGWQTLSAWANSATVVWPDAVQRLSHWLALLLVWRGAGACAGPDRQRTAAWLLVLAAAFGLLQRAGLGEVLGYGVPTQPVSWFGNLNVAAEFVAVAGAATAVLWPDCRWLCSAALVLGGAYAAVNGSRSALLALPLALGFAAALGRGPFWLRLGPLLSVGLGIAVGLLGERALPAHGAAEPAAIAREKVASVEVRLEIARGALAMIGDAPVLGHGPGQFAVQYPRYRSQREIELSSNNRTDVRAVGTAHDDWLEVSTEGGLVALLLLLSFAALVLRQNPDRRTLAPLVALALLMAVRAPLGNAAASGLALFCACPSRATTGGGPTWPLRLLALPLLWVGGLVVVAQTLLGAYVLERRHAPLGNPARLELALYYAPFQPAVWQLLAQERLARATNRRDIERALSAADQAVALRPHEPAFRLLRADLHRLLGDYQRARDELRVAAALDPGDPVLQLQLAGLAFTAGDAATAIATLHADPHPRLRRELARHCDEFADLARRAGEVGVQRRFVAEAAFLRALEASAGTGRTARAAAKILLEDAHLGFRAAGLERDLRPFLLEAWLALADGDAATADAVSVRAAAADARLPAWSRSLLGPLLADLQVLPAWAALLAEDR